MIRARFQQPTEDYRPIIWPIKHPYWCSGQAGDGSYWILVAYAGTEDEILTLWPEAENIEIEEVDSYTFTERFPRPIWFD